MCTRFLWNIELDEMGSSYVLLVFSETKNLFDQGVIAAMV